MPATGIREVSVYQVKAKRPCFLMTADRIKRTSEMTRLRSSLFVGMLGSCVIIMGSCGARNPIPQDLSPAVILQQQDKGALHDELAAQINAASAEPMTTPGLVGVAGGVRVKLFKSGAQAVMMPLPQMVDGQVPLSFCVRCTPPDAAVEYRLQKREGRNDILSVSLKGERGDEIQLEWLSVVLIAGRSILPEDSLPDAYRSATACVQSDSASIRELAEKLWPESGEVKDYARNIQRFIGEMQHAKQPRSLDAMEILDSAMNTICTANANLALSLLRAKGVPARSMAVIPPVARKLEMHRIVEYRDGDQRHYFDPSLLHADVPMEPWQTVIMAKTTLADEDLAMTPRMGAMLGCPYGQEAEMQTAGVSFSGQDFFWTMAKPLARFEPDDAVVSLAVDAWTKFLQEGVLSTGQVNASTASSLQELAENLKSK